MDPNEPDLPLSTPFLDDSENRSRNRRRRSRVLIAVVLIIFVLTATAAAAFFVLRHRHHGAHDFSVDIRSFTGFERVDRSIARVGDCGRHSRGGECGRSNPGRAQNSRDAGSAGGDGGGGGFSATLKTACCSESP